MSTPLKWASSGVRERPRQCVLCPLNKVCTGFVPDHVPTSPQVAFLLDHPSADDVLEQRPLAGKAGRYWLWRLLPPGKTREDIIISHVLRCKPNRAYPTGNTRRLTELYCRRYDDRKMVDGRLAFKGLETWNPNFFVVTHHPRDIRLTPPLHRLIKQDIAKAFRFAEKQYRPIVLFGQEAVELILPWVSGRGGLKTWRGHFGDLEWPFKGGDPVAPTQQPLFKFIV